MHWVLAIQATLKEERSAVWKCCRASQKEISCPGWSELAWLPVSGWTLSTASHSSWALSTSVLTTAGAHPLASVVRARRTL